MARRRLPASEHRIAVLVPEGFSLLGLGAVLEVFSGSPTRDRGASYRVVVCSTRPGSVAIEGSLFRADIRNGLEALEGADTVVVPDWADGGSADREPLTAAQQVHARGTRLVPEWSPCAPRPSDEAVGALRRAHARGCRVVSWGTGTELLAEAGLLDRRDAAVHWAAAPAFARRFPAVRVDARVLYVDGGDVVTGAGAAASLDVCLHLLRRDHGVTVAHEVAQRLTAGLHRHGSQQQLLRAPIAEAVEANDPILDVMAYAVEHLDEDLTGVDLARRAYMSTRHFSRRFREATGTSPTRWVALQRLERARQLLESTDRTVEHVAYAVGFSSPVTFRQRFAREVGQSPSAYRREHRAHRASAAPAVAVLNALAARTG